MSCYHYVLVSTPLPDGESTAVIGVNLADGILIYVDLAASLFIGFWLNDG